MRGPAPSRFEQSPLLWDGRYELLYPLWTGARCDLGVARDPLRGGRSVVIKRLRAEAQPEWPAFLREYRIHRQLSHPNIPRAFEFGFTRDGELLCPYAVLEYRPAISLARWVSEQRRCPMALKFELALEMARALDHIHRQGFIHADLQPDHILVHERDGRFFFSLVDFGLALPRNRSVGDEIWRRPHFSAPELLEGGIVDPRTDLYALGRVLEWLESQVGNVQGGGDAASALGTFVSRCLETSPSRRPPSAASAIALLSSGEAPDIEPEEAFLSRLLGLPHPQRAMFETWARQLCLAADGEPCWTVVEVGEGVSVKRLLGAAMDEASARRARVIPLFDGHGDLASGAEEVEVLLEAFESEASTEDAERVVFFAIEDFSGLSEQLKIRLTSLSQRHVRILAVNRNRDASERAMSGYVHLRGERVRRESLDGWTMLEFSGWLHRALGRIGAPWERDGFGEVAPPDILIEWLTELFRLGFIVRAQDGYAWREVRQVLPALGTWPLPSSLERRLACIEVPVSRVVLERFLGVWMQEVDEALASGSLHETSDGCIPVALRLLDDRNVEAGQHDFERLARCLETGHAPHLARGRAWMSAGRPELALSHLQEVFDAGGNPGQGLIERLRRQLEQWAPSEHLSRCLELEVRVHLLAQDYDRASATLTVLDAMPLDAHATWRGRLLRSEIALRREDLTESSRAIAGPAPEPMRREQQLRRHLVRAFGLRAEGLPGAVVGEADAGLAYRRLRTNERGRQGVELDALERRLLVLRYEVATDALWDEPGEPLNLMPFNVETGRGWDRGLAIAARRQRFLGRLDRAMEILGRCQTSSPHDREAEEAFLLEQAWTDFELGDFELAESRAIALVSKCWHLRTRAEAGLLSVLIHARQEGAKAALGRLRRVELQAMAPTDPLVVDARLTRLELELIESRGHTVANLVDKAVGLGHALLRRLQGRRAARAFTLAAEASMAQFESRSVSEYVRLCAHALTTIHRDYIMRPFFALSAARAFTHDLRLVEAEERHAHARSSLIAASLAIDSPELRERWLVHPDQKALLAASGGDFIKGTHGAPACLALPFRF